VTGIAVIAVVLLAPFVIRALNEVSGLTGSRALQRTLWMIPFPALVGLLAAFPLFAVVDRFSKLRGRGLRELVPFAPALVCAALLVGFDHPLWLGPAGSRTARRGRAGRRISRRFGRPARFSPATTETAPSSPTNV
jgi:hypothetical protein